MTETIDTDICVIGAGSAGLTMAAGASQLGARTVLIEGHKMGGDCLNYGCVPSKALLAAAHAAEAARRARGFGVETGGPIVDFARVRDHLRQVIAAIAPNDSAARFEGLGVRVILAGARFTGPSEIIAGDYAVRARRFVIATGSSPLVPPIRGLDAVAYHTNETIFDLDRRPRHLVVVGGGPVGCELAQAFRLLGAEVSLVEMGSILPKDDPELVELLRRRLVGDGIRLYEGARVVGVERTTDGIGVEVEGASERIVGSELLIAAGRRAKLAGLGLEAAGIKATPEGVAVNDRLRTANRRVYAIGDAVGDLPFTHMAAYHAGIVIRNALFRLPAKVDRRAAPWVTFTDPELAQVGLGEAAARAEGRPIRILRWPFADNDRAQTERTTEGLVKAIVGPRGRILGASILGPRAGELIHPWVLAIASGLKIGALAQMIAPYPTLGEAGKRAAGSYFAPRLFSQRTRRLVRFLLRFG